MSFLLEDGNVVFSTAIVLMLFIAIMEGVLMLIGFGVSQVFDSLLPDMELNTDMPDGYQANGLSRLLGWIRFGQVPALVILILFLTIFGLLGIGLQLMANTLIGATLPPWLASIPAILLTLPLVRISTGLLQNIALKDETEAISSSTFVGNVAIITLGIAKKDCPAEARFTDKFGTTHYTMVEPDGDQTYSQGDKVLLVEQVGSIFKVIKSQNQHLT